MFPVAVAVDYCKIGINGTGAGVLVPADSADSIFPTYNFDETGEVFWVLVRVATGDMVVGGDKPGILMPSPNKLVKPPPRAF